MLQHGPQRQRHRGQQQQNNQPPGRLIADPEPVDDPFDGLCHQFFHVAPESGDHRRQRAHMEHQVKGYRVYIVPLKIHQRLHQRQMAGRRDGEKLRQSLHRA